MLKGLFVLLPVLALLVAACGSSESGTHREPARNSEGYFDISVEQLKTILSNKDFRFVNVHTPYEGHIAQTDQFIPFDKIASRLEELPGKGERLVLYCRSGNMSADAAKQLADRGYTNVYELTGGFNAWVAAGHDLLKDPSAR